MICLQVLLTFLGARATSVPDL